jgi:nicotinic acid mononucleotide adenylyltransferase
MSNTIHIYNGGSFSPVTLAHQQMCIDTIKAMQKHFLETTKTKIIMWITPVPDVYPKETVKPACISYDARRAMLEIMISNVQKTFDYTFEGKTYELEIKLNDIEMIVSHEPNKEGSGENGFVGTYMYVSEFAKRNSINPNDVYLLYGLDNGKNMFRIDDGRWKSPIHLISKFKFLIYPRSGSSIDYSEFIKLYSSNIVTFNPATNPKHIDINLETNTHDLDDLKTELYTFYLDPLAFMKDHFVEVVSPTTTGEDGISFAETSSSNIRKVLYYYADFRIKSEIISEQLKMIDPQILAFIQENGLYTNGLVCEGEKKYLQIIDEIPPEWKE